MIRREAIYSAWQIIINAITTYRRPRLSDDNENCLAAISRDAITASSERSLTESGVPHLSLLPLSYADVSIVIINSIWTVIGTVTDTFGNLMATRLVIKHKKAICNRSNRSSCHESNSFKTHIMYKMLQKTRTWKQRDGIVCRMSRRDFSNVRFRR